MIIDRCYKERIARYLRTRASRDEMAEISLGIFLVDAAGGGDGTSIDDAIGTADICSIWVKRGTYNEAFTADVAKQHIYLEPGTVINLASTISADDFSLELGSGSDLGATLTVSGNNCSIISRNGCSFDAITVSGDSLLLDGGGLGSDVAGGLTLQSGATDSLLLYFQSDTSGAVNNILVQGGARNDVKFLKLDATNGRNVYDDTTTSTELQLLGNFLVDASSDGISVGSGRHLISANSVNSSGADGIELRSTSEDGATTGNLVKDPTSNSINFVASATDLVGVGNRLDGALSDSSTGSTVDANDETAF